jgi:hypothetical protein
VFGRRHGKALQLVIKKLIVLARVETEVRFVQPKTRKKGKVGKEFVKGFHSVFRLLALRFRGLIIGRVKMQASSPTGSPVGLLVSIPISPGVPD